MLYSILIDHIYHIDFVKYNKYNVLTNILIFCRHRLIIAVYYLLLNEIIPLLQKHSVHLDSPKYFWLINLFSNYIKNIILYSLGCQTSKDFKSINDFSFFEEKGLENL